MVSAPLPPVVPVRSIPTVAAASVAAASVPILPMAPVRLTPTVAAANVAVASARQRGAAVRSIPIVAMASSAAVASAQPQPMAPVPLTRTAAVASVAAASAPTLPLVPVRSIPIAVLLGNVAAANAPESSCFIMRTRPWAIMRSFAVIGLGVGISLIGCRPTDQIIGFHADTDSAVVQDLAITDAVADSQRVRPDLRALTYNTHLFFDTVCDSGRCTPSDFEQVPTMQAFTTKADAVATALRGLSADVIALQEIENQTALDALRGRLRDLYPTVVLGETGLPGSIDVAVLGAGSLLLVRTHRSQTLTRPDGSTTSFTRELLEVHMMIKGRRVVMFAAHFRSKVSDDPGRRLAEAQAARDIVLKTAAEFPDAAVLLGGDLNDTPGSPPLDAMESAPNLMRVAKDRPAASVATYSFNGTEQAIDHLFVARTARVSYVAGSASAQHDSNRFGLAGSDHAALLADFALH